MEVNESYKIAYAGRIGGRHSYHLHQLREHLKNIPNKKIIVELIDTSTLSKKDVKYLMELVGSDYKTSDRIKKHLIDKLKASLVRKVVTDGE